jgi:cell fate regulator YaaT (PSP1 superfamily)
MAENAPGATRVAAVRFECAGKVYYFDCAHVDDLREGDYVVVTTSRGKEMARVVSIMEEAGPPPEKGWKPVERRATPQELVLRRTWQQREAEALVECRAKAAEMGLNTIKIARAAYSFDGSGLTFYYAGEGEEKADLKKLRQALRGKFRRTRVEFRSIGPRDLAKVMGGMGACGLAERCCTRFIVEFSPISIKMAKAQGVSLNPQEITGMCGRLRCCLLYEFEQYAEARKGLPRLKKRVLTPQGEGRVVDVLALKGTVVVQFEDGQRAEFERDEIEPYEELTALKDNAKHPQGKASSSDDEKHT